MKTRQIPAILLFCCCLAAVSAWPQTAQGKHSAWKTYRSPAYGFTIDYPASMSFSSGHPVEAPQLSMFPICDDTTVACFQYNGKKLDGTPVRAVGISVNVLRDLKDAKSCSTIDDGTVPNKAIRIHGTLFHFGDSGDAGLGSGRSMTEYRTFHQHVCFEVAVGTSGRNVGPEEMKDEGLHPVSQRTWSKLWNDMDRMLHSFTFAGPVRDGADWTVYSDSGCGQTFEYPSLAKLEVVLKYADDAFDSDKITCEQAFTYQGRKYTVAVKVNLKDEEARDWWLSFWGYPAPEQMKILAKGDNFTEYRDGTHVYLWFQNDLFILTVWDPDEEAASSNSDAVFAHLIESFQVR
jgi:hypothetical protein